MSKSAVTKQDLMIAVSQVAPISLSLVLLTEHIARKYDKPVKKLVERRAYLARKFRSMVKRNKMIQAFPGSVSLRVNCCSMNYSTGFDDMLKEYSVNYPSSPMTGAERVLVVDSLPKGHALSFFLWHQFDRRWSRNPSTRPALQSGYGEVVGDPEFCGYGWDDSTIKVKPDVENKYHNSMTVYLSDIDEQLGMEVDQLVKDEVQIYSSMLSDMGLMASKVLKVKELPSLFRRLPELRKHPRLEQLLGANDSPAGQRVANLNHLLSGAGLLGEPMPAKA